jgi:hypothetical protein
MPDLTDDIEANAEGPKKAQGDQGSMEMHSLPNQIEADRYLKANEAARTLPDGGIRRRRIANSGGE